MRQKIFTENGKQYVIVPTPVETRYLILEAPTSFDKVEAVMMDMDGSTTDTEKLVLEAMLQMLAEALDNPEFRFAKEDFPHIIGDSTTNHVKYLVGKYNLDVAQLNFYINTYYAKYHRILGDVRDGRVADDVLIEPMPGLGPFLAVLKERAFVIEDSTAGILAGRIAGFAVAAMPHRYTQDHDFTLANLGLMRGGLREILEKNFFLV